MYFMSQHEIFNLKCLKPFVTNKNNGEKMSIEYRDLFFKNNVPPYECYFCKKVLPTQDDVAAVHHIDGDDTNNSLDNLTASHGPCHTRYHSSAEGRKVSKKKRGKKSLPKAIELEDAEKLVASPNIRYITGLRNRLVLEMMLRCGLRVSEVCNLKVRNIRQSDWRVEIREGKTGDRFVYLPREMEPLMQVWLRRRLDELPKTDALFPTHSGKPITRLYVYGMLERMAKRAGVEKTHPHALRHTFATEFIRNGGSTSTLQQILGHSTAVMSLRYAQANPVDVKKAMRK
jgi:integrase